jgi:hypothetical protein
MPLDHGTVEMYQVKSRGLGKIVTFSVPKNPPTSPSRCLRRCRLVRFGSKTDLNPDYQTISNMSAIRSQEPIAKCRKCANKRTLEEH